MRAISKSIFLTGLTFFWLVAVVAGLVALARYSNAPGTSLKTSSDWPADSRILPNQLIAGRLPVLIMFLHPKCPCSRASVDQLDALLAKTKSKARVVAVFVQPSGWNDTQVKGQLWKQASSIPGVEVIIDPQGAEARRFGASTSGHLLAFDSKGQLAYTGGITRSRGHMGDNAGLNAAIQFINTGQTLLKQTRIFGCSLFRAQTRVNASAS